MMTSQDVRTKPYALEQQHLIKSSSRNSLLDNAMESIGTLSLSSDKSVPY